MKENFYLMRLVRSASPWRAGLFFAVRCVSYAYGAFYTLLLFRFLINALEKGGTAQEIVLFLAVFCVFGLATSLFKAWYAHVFLPSSDAEIESKLCVVAYEKAVSADLAAFEDSEAFDARAKAISLLREKAVAATVNVCEIAATVFVLFLNGGFTLLVDPTLLPLCVAPTALILLLEKRRGKLTAEMRMACAAPERQADYARRVIYQKEYAEEVRVTNVARLTYRRFAAALSDLRALADRYGPKIAFARFGAELILQVALYAGLYAYISWRYLFAHAFTLGDFTSVSGAIINIVWFVEEIGSRFSQARENKAYGESVRSFLSLENAIQTGERTCRMENTIEFRNVSFTYPGRGKPALQNISFTLQKGETVALVGLNGAGKSTLVKLLLRLYDPDEGQIVMDGVPYQEYRLDELRAQFACAFQDARLYALPVSDNVLLGGIGDAKAALDAAGLNVDPARETTREFDENGFSPSLGQAAKLCAARVFVSGAPVAVLDEPSAALDPLAERALFENLTHACAGRAILFVTHRLSSAKYADRILVLDEGKIAQRGSHDALMREDGPYKRLFDMQAEKYREEANLHAAR